MLTSIGAAWWNDTHYEHHRELCVLDFLICRMPVSRPAANMHLTASAQQVTQKSTHMIRFG